ncbi:MAG: response regulator transcription factor [Acidobacteria bacterium]|nr:response regulator transcription factor [Acidobacteriota bacterium]
MDSILLVEDEHALRMTLGDRLRKEGYVVDCAADGEEGFAKATQLPFDLIILDIMLPRRDGLDVCSGIRGSGVITPILMLTARGRTPDKVAGLKIGADDYVTKPFKMPELLARIEALLRRAPTRPSAPSAVYEFGRIRVDVRGTEVVRDGKVLSLSAREFQLLRFFLEHQGATLSREDLLTRVWGYSASTFTRTVDVHVASLRQKLEEDPRQPRFFLTVQGIGYKFKP